MTIKKTITRNLSYQGVTFQAYNGRGKIIGASATVYREQNLDTDKWEEWKTGWASSSDYTYKDQLPHFKVIEKAVDYLKNLK